MMSESTRTPSRIFIGQRLEPIGDNPGDVNVLLEMRDKSITDDEIVLLAGTYADRWLNVYYGTPPESHDDSRPISDFQNFWQPARNVLAEEFEDFLKRHRYTKEAQDSTSDHIHPIIQAGLDTRFAHLKDNHVAFLELETWKTVHDRLQACL
jgi:hypothetical protein